MKIAWVLLATAALGCGSIEPIVACDAIGDMQPLCGFQNPEDLALLPDGKRVLVSEFGGMSAERPGLLSLLDLDSGEHRVLFRGGMGNGGPKHWGDPACPGPPPAEFSPHGMDLARRPDGALELLAVQHGGRESVEMFEVTTTHDDVSLAWRGCVVAPDEKWFNDVVHLPEGGFLVTHMLPRRAGFGQAVEFAKTALLGMETGHVMAWSPDGGFQVVPGTAGAMPNGIEVSEDGNTLFLNLTLGNAMRRIDRASGALEAEAAVPTPDNSTWAPDGRLLVASLRMSPTEMLACGEIERGSCPAAYAIVAIDPETLETEEIYVGGPGTPMGAGTVGLAVGDELLMGSFAGDRILRVPRLGRAS